VLKWVDQKRGREGVGLESDLFFFLSQETSTVSSHSMEQKMMMSSTGSNILDKVMTPSAEYDSSSLKRRESAFFLADLFLNA
jgi:hypothetical protein